MLFQQRKPGRLIDLGNGEKGIAYNCEQHPKFAKAGKLFIRKIDAAFQPIRKDGKDVNVIRKADSVKVIGFID